MFFFKKKKPNRQPEEQVSVTLKRQVPIRHEETPRSWLGGLPMMPETQNWPLDGAGKPLPFLAQVSCHDLPEQLWGGLGPRQGWLLLFLQTHGMEGEAEHPEVQVLHVDALGPEREPPEDMPTMRHTMSDYIGIYEPNIRAGVPKLWRKWPVDLVAQSYLVDEDVMNSGAPVIPAQELYGAPVAQRGIFAFLEQTDIDRPLTWRGALYFLERLLKDYGPEKLASSPKSNFNPAQVDKRYFDNEVKARFDAHPGSKEREFGFQQRHQELRNTIKDALATEWRHGWLKSYFAVQEKEVVRFEAAIAENEKGLREGGDQYRYFYENQIVGQTRSLSLSKQTRAYIDAVCEGQSLNEAEVQLWRDIDGADAAYADWQIAIKDTLEDWKPRILAQNMDARMPDRDWAALKESLSTTVMIWSTQHYGGAAMRFEHKLYLGNALEMALREDLLDLYARGELVLPDAQMADLEEGLRVTSEVPHRMGGFPNPIQGDIETDSALLFQLSSDVALGWMWDDAGALYVDVPPKDLTSANYSRVKSKTEGG